MFELCIANLRPTHGDWVEIEFQCGCYAMHEAEYLYFPHELCEDESHNMLADPR